MGNNDKIAIGSDHAGYKMKEFLKKELHLWGIEIEDMGTHNETESVDYPIYAEYVAQAVLKGVCKRGILICGTGLGMSIAVNRFSNIRAALCTSEEMAKLSRLHNNSNVLVLGGRVISEKKASTILKTWFNERFEEGRHTKRLALLETLSFRKK